MTFRTVFCTKGRGRMGFVWANPLEWYRREFATTGRDGQEAEAGEQEYVGFRLRDGCSDAYRSEWADHGDVAILHLRWDGIRGAEVVPEAVARSGIVGVILTAE